MSSKDDESGWTMKSGFGPTGAESRGAAASDVGDTPREGEYAQDGPPNNDPLPPPDDGMPSHIGRYRIDRSLGRGGFGVVYLAHDEKLLRRVAVKVPHKKHVLRPENAAAYLREAQTVASLDHPNIVPVHDAGADEHFPCYVVSKYVDGTDLATLQKNSPLALGEIVKVVA